jgi:hypothetical protein
LPEQHVPPQPQICVPQATETHVVWHAPPLQVDPDPQAWPHDPQFEKFESVSTHAPEHVV